jgi:hypothetical protein
VGCSVCPPKQLARFASLHGFRNRTFAEAFEHANTSQVWSARDQARMRKWSGIAALLFLGGHIGARPLLWYFEGR